MTSFCKSCQASFDVEDRDLVFYDRISPVINGVKYAVPSPSLCPSCRLQRRLAFRNQIFVYLRPSSTTGKPIFSMFPEDVPFPVIDKDEWWGDSWDARDYGREFDFSKDFFAQFEELRNQVPHYPLSVLHMENSDYCNNAGYIRNCYFVFNSNEVDDCMYGERVSGSRDCLECSYTVHSELCYDCVQCERCYGVQSSRYCDDCVDSYFLLNCRSCKNCFGCVNLRRSEYCVFNEQLSKEEYQEFLAGLDLSSYSIRDEIRKKAEAFFLEHPRPHSVVHMSEDVSGNMLAHSRNVHDSFIMDGCENVRFGYNLYENVRDSYDFSLFGMNAELMYECCVCGINSFNMRFCFDCWEGCADLDYCWMCSNTKDCFGCVGLRRAQYCIFNRQYSEEEYKELVPRIIEHMRSTEEWGEFFPVRLSPTAYNRSLAGQVFPITREGAEELGCGWYDIESVSREGALSTNALPDGLPEHSDSITVLSAESNRPFKITSKEIERYRKFQVPLPRTTYDERMAARSRFLNGVHLFERACAKSGEPVLTTFAPDSPWVVWEREVFEQEFSG